MFKLYHLWKYFRNALLYSVFGYVSVCHHIPSCSEYAAKEVREHGTISGLARALPRVLTCR